MSSVGKSNYLLTSNFFVIHTFLLKILIRRNDAVHDLDCTSTWRDVQFTAVFGSFQCISSVTKGAN